MERNNKTYMEIRKLEDDIKKAKVELDKTNSHIMYMENKLIELHEELNKTYNPPVALWRKTHKKDEKESLKEEE